MELDELLSDIEGIGEDTFQRSTPPPRSEPAAAIPAPAPTPAPDPVRATSVPAAAPCAAEAPGSPMERLGHVIDAELELLVELGHTRMSLRDLMALEPGMSFPLVEGPGEPLGIFVHDRLIARGEALVVDGALAIRILELLPDGRVN